MEVIKDERLWKIAKKRAGFKKHLATYIIVNGFLWAIWFVTESGEVDVRHFYNAWPIWTTLGWGIGLAFNYVSAYHSVGADDSVQREYDRLKNDRK
ncbi:MAG: hypothetical protein JWO03_3101 [Bacteroidetes bacterium]|nr:hypothetical protein [Bacteroidota bacterium]